MKIKKKRNATSVYGVYAAWDVLDATTNEGRPFECDIKCVTVSFRLCLSCSRLVAAPHHSAAIAIHSVVGAESGFVDDQTRCDLSFYFIFGGMCARCSAIDVALLSPNDREQNPKTSERASERGKKR